MRFIEELSFNAWPSSQTMYYDGWVLRISGGHRSRRVNSVNALYPSTIDLEEKIDHCEQIYRARGQRAVFKLTESTQPDGLDSALEKRGYAYEAPTSVQMLTLDDVEKSAINSITVDTELTEEWYESFCSLGEVDSRYRETLHELLSNVVPQAGFASLRVRGEIMVVGLGVVDAGYVGLFDVVTDERSRLQGLGTQLILNLLHWGVEHGARHAYLQVMTENTPATRLYHKLGFRQEYLYWYRTKPFENL